MTTFYIYEYIQPKYLLEKSKTLLSPYTFITSNPFDTQSSSEWFTFGKKIYMISQYPLTDHKNMLLFAYFELPSNILNILKNNLIQNAKDSGIDEFIPFLLVGYMFSEYQYKNSIYRILSVYIMSCHQHKRSEPTEIRKEGTDENIMITDQIEICRTSINNFIHFIRFTYNMDVPIQTFFRARKRSAKRSGKRSVKRSGKRSAKRSALKMKSKK